VRIMDVTVETGPAVERSGIRGFRDDMSG